MNPQDNAQHVFYKALHTFCHSTDIERHRQNATEELRDRRQQGDRERRMVARQREMYVRGSNVLCTANVLGQHLAGESQRRAQETNQPLTVYTGIDIAIIFYRETRLSASQLKAADQPKDIAEVTLQS